MQWNLTEKEVFTTEKAGDETKKIALADIATASMYGHEIPLEVTESRTAHISPPPFMAGAVELEIDMETGETSVINYAAAVDCGTPINPNLSRLQVEGGLMAGNRHGADGKYYPQCTGWCA